MRHNLIKPPYIRYKLSYVWMYLRYIPGQFFGRPVI